jgi:Metal binding domain of Ada
MTSRNLAFIVVLISAVSVAFLLGKNAALNEELTESQVRQPLQHQSPAATPEPTASPVITPKPTSTPKAKPAPLPPSDEPEVETEPKKAMESPRATAPAPKESADAARSCVIIGNRNSGIYHLPGCPSYNRVAAHNRDYFCTQDDAQKAGYRKARNC